MLLITMHGDVTCGSYHEEGCVGAFHLHTAGRPYQGRFSGVEEGLDFLEQQCSSSPENSLKAVGPM
jgi:hypothetical protein